MEWAVPVGEIGPAGQLDHRIAFEGYEPQSRQKHQQNEQRRVVKGKNPQRPAHEEGAVIVGRIARVQQNAGDEESAQDEEQLNADPAPMQSGDDQLRSAERGDQVEVVRNDQENRDRPKAVESGQTRRHGNGMCRVRGAHGWQSVAAGIGSCIPAANLRLLSTYRLFQGSPTTAASFGYPI